MSKFKKGDPVRCIENDYPSRVGNLIFEQGETHGAWEKNFELVDEPATVSYEPPPGLLDWAKKELLPSMPNDVGWEEGFSGAIRSILLNFYGLRTVQKPVVAATVEFVKVSKP